jgi:hypothetical protein
LAEGLSDEFPGSQDSGERQRGEKANFTGEDWFHEAGLCFLFAVVQNKNWKIGYDASTATLGSHAADSRITY